MIQKNSIPIRTKEVALYNANILYGEFGTSCPKGGDSGHGGRTYIKISADGTDWKIKVSGKEYVYPDSLEIEAGGDAEAETLANLFLIIGKSLLSQQRGIDLNHICDDLGVEDEGAPDTKIHIDETVYFWNEGNSRKIID